MRRNNRGSALLRGVAKGAGFAVGMKAAGAVMNSVSGRNSQQRANQVTQRAVSCFNCRGRNQANMRFCGHCGTDMFAANANGLECHECGFICENGFAHCGNCGTRF